MNRGPGPGKENLAGDNSQMAKTYYQQRAAGEEEERRSRTMKLGSLARERLFGNFGKVICPRLMMGEIGFWSLAS